MFYAKGMDDGENVGTAIPLLVHYEMLARSWAEGGTGIREGEDENNARFWAELSNAMTTAARTGSIRDLVTARMPFERNVRCIFKFSILIE